MFEFKIFFFKSRYSVTHSKYMYQYFYKDLVKTKIKQEGNTFDVNIAAHWSQHPLTKLLHSGMLKLGRGSKS